MTAARRRTITLTVGTLLVASVLTYCAATATNPCEKYTGKQKAQCERLEFP